MGRSVIFSEGDTLRFIGSMAREGVENDVYEIGDEGNNPPVGGNMYHVDENMNFEVDSSDVDLSSFRKKGSLAEIWDSDGNLDSRVRLRLLDIADDFWKFVNIKWVSPSGVILTGSICNFNWSSSSDIDLHLIVDFSEVDDKTEFVRDYMDAKKNEWNDEHDGLTIMGHVVELYVQDIDDEVESKGVYDLEGNKWVIRPSKSDVSQIGLNKFPIKDKAAEIMTLIDGMCKVVDESDDMHEIEEVGEDAEYLLGKLRRMRKESLGSNGEGGSGNIVYKVLRMEGYIDKLWHLRSVCYNKVKSIFAESVASNISIIREEVVADGNSEHNPYVKRWREERDALKRFICNYGKIMTSKENGKQYKCYYDKVMSELIGYNYCICLQWDPVTLEPGSTLYIRALDKFTNRLFQPKFDDRGRDNVRGTSDDNSRNRQYGS